MLPYSLTQLSCMTELSASQICRIFPYSQLGVGGPGRSARGFEMYSLHMKLTSLYSVKMPKVRARGPSSWTSAFMTTEVGSRDDIPPMLAGSWAASVGICVPRRAPTPTIYSAGGTYFCRPISQVRKITPKLWRRTPAHGVFKIFILAEFCQILVCFRPQVLYS